MTNGTVACWGDNSLGQSTPPGGSFSQVAADGFHTCAVRTDTTAACWGKDTNGLGVTRVYTEELLWLAGQLRAVAPP